MSIAEDWQVLLLPHPNVHGLDQPQDCALVDQMSDQLTELW